MLATSLDIKFHITTNTRSNFSRSQKPRKSPRKAKRVDYSDFADGDDDDDATQDVGAGVQPVSNTLEEEEETQGTQQTQTQEPSPILTTRRRRKAPDPPEPEKRKPKKKTAVEQNLDGIETAAEEKRKRADKWTESLIDHLLDGMEDERDVLKGTRKSGPGVNARKRACWDRITGKYVGTFIPHLYYLLYL